ncbi:MAG TPA: TetR/AcrR family transcriptional regulator [Anaerolineaceae bacterium]|nr:TetR/AcrR family transcriptional regulator [Anaerolineaceae bacterium]
MNNREKILAFALDLFAARGYDAVGIQEVAEAAGVTKPTLYHYFGSKRGLLDSLLAERFDRLNQVLREAADNQRDLPQTLDNIAAAIFQFASDNPDWYRMELSMWFAPPDSEPFQAVSRLNREQHQIIEDMFAQAAFQHGNMKGRQRAYAATFQGMLNTYIGMALNGYVRLDEALRRQAVHQFMHGIYS